MATTAYDTLNSIMEWDKTQSAPISGSSFFMEIDGYPTLSLEVQTGSLPMPKVQNMEYTTSVGVTLGAKGGVQLWQSIPLSFLERESLQTKNELVKAIGNAYKDRNNITINFYAGDARSMDTKPWGKIVHAHFTNEEGAEFDVESKDAPLKISGFTLEGWYIATCEDTDQTVKANSLALLEKMKGFKEGLEDC